MSQCRRCRILAVARWAMVGLALSGSALNSCGNRWGFALWLITNAFWGIYNAGKREWAQVVIFAAFWLLSLWGLLTW